jgi:hypothetical protein
MASLVNHSCRPTASRVFLGDLMFVRAARDLQVDEEVTDGYISVLQPALERRAKIRQRYGFELSEDRALVEEALIPGEIVAPLLRRIDAAESLGDFGDLSEAIRGLVQQKMAQLGQRDLNALNLSSAQMSRVEAAALRLGPGVERLLFGGLAMPVLVAIAAFRDQQGEHQQAALAYCRCCWFMEELAPHNAYHARWALAARRQRAPAFPWRP